MSAFGPLLPAAVVLYLASITATGLSSLSYQVRSGSIAGGATVIEVACRAASGAHSGSSAAGDRSSGGGHQEILEHFPHVEDEASHDDGPDAVLDGPMRGDQLRQLQCPVVALVQSRSRRGRFGTSGGRCDVCEGAAEPGQPRLQTGRDYRGIEQNHGGGEQQLVFGDVFARIRRSGSPAGSASEESSGDLIARA